MKNETLYHKTIDILVKAYLNDTLKHRDCAACAVGNMIQANMNLTQEELRARIFQDDWAVQQGWPLVFCTSGSTQVIDPEFYTGEAKIQIDSTGYSWAQLAKIEKAFESSKVIVKTKDEAMYNGLMNVVEVLGEIHEVSKEQVEESKLLFVKP